MGLNFEDMIGTGLGWAREGNAYVCSHGKTFLLVLWRASFGMRRHIRVAFHRMPTWPSWTRQTDLCSVPGSMLNWKPALFGVASLVWGASCWLSRQHNADQPFRSSRRRPGSHFMLLSPAHTVSAYCTVLAIANKFYQSSQRARLQSSDRS